MHACAAQSSLEAAPRRALLHGRRHELARIHLPRTVLARSWPLVIVHTEKDAVRAWGVRGMNGVGRPSFPVKLYFTMATTKLGLEAGAS